jgi:hypothetical protein
MCPQGLMYRRERQQWPRKNTGDNSILTLNDKLEILPKRNVIIHEELFKSKCCQQL